MIPIFLTFLDTRILASHFAETATWRHPVPSPWHPPATHRNSRSRYAMAKADRDLMPSTGIMNPSHTVETKVREEASGSDPLRALKNFLAPRPSLSLPHCLSLSLPLSHLDYQIYALAFWCSYKYFKHFQILDFFLMQCFRELIMPCPCVQ